jgi:hypothetical protein
VWFNLLLIREGRKQSLLNQFKTGSNSGVTLFKPPGLCSVIPLNGCTAELTILNIIRVHTHRVSDMLVASCVALPLGSVQNRPVNTEMLHGIVGARPADPNCCW